MDIHEIVKKLVGSITPIGQSSIDNERFENLQVMCDLVDKLLTDLDDMSHWNKNSHEFSVKRAGKYAEDFLNLIKTKDEK